MSHRFGRRDFLRTTVLAAAAAKTAEAATPPAPPFEFEEATVSALQEAMAAGKTTAKALTQAYLARIAEVDKKLHAFLETNPTAVADAEALDLERKEKGPRGPLHGIPVALKDNIDVAGPMQTTAGSLALVGVPTLGDAPVVERLKNAGAVILGKTNMAEWANARGMPSSNGWSARGGITRNPYALDRSGSGSSTGSAVAVSANLCAVAVGTETDGSVVSPASVNGVVGIKPTVGLVSRTGIIPISSTQDTAGAFGRTVADAAALLTAMASVDVNDSTTLAKARPTGVDYTQGLSMDGLKGVKLGVVRSTQGRNRYAVRTLNAALPVLRELGATVIDGLKLPEVDELVAMQTEFKATIAAYLEQRRPQSPYKTLADLIDFNEENAVRELVHFGQEFFVQSNERGPMTAAAYKSARAKNVEAARTKGIDALLAKNKLDALVAIADGPAGLIDLMNGDNWTGAYGGSAAAVAGYPSLSVPMGRVFGLPVGLLFFGRAWSEAQLIRYAYVFEQATKVREVPQLYPMANVASS